jgi:hypothetical protein
METIAVCACRDANGESSANRQRAVRRNALCKNILFIFFPLLDCLGDGTVQGANFLPVTILCGIPCWPFPLYQCKRPISTPESESIYNSRSWQSMTLERYACAGRQAWPRCRTEERTTVAVQRVDCGRSSWDAFLFYAFALPVCISIRGEHRAWGTHLSRGFSEEFPRNFSGSASC